MQVRKEYRFHNPSASSSLTSYCSETDYAPSGYAGNENHMLNVNTFATMHVLHHLICKTHFHTLSFLWPLASDFLMSTLETLH